MLADANVNSAKLSCEMLLADATGLSRVDLYSHFDDKLDDKAFQIFRQYIERRSKHEPVQYILGYTYFRGLKIYVEQGVLIPRPETEQLIEAAIKNLKHNRLKILDLCTGSGCISCAFANEFSAAEIVATDISKMAISCAKKNVQNNNFDQKIKLLQCDLDQDVVDVDFDLIICNPPYVPEKIYEMLDKEVLDFEPKLALVADDFGTSFLRRIIGVSKNRLKSKGLVALEFFEDNLELAKEEFENEGFENCTIYKDLAERNRILIAQKQ